MTKTRWGAVAVASLCAGAGAGSFAAPGPYEAFRDANPGAQVFTWQGRVSRVYGAPFSHGATLEASADAFLAEHASDLFGVQPGELALVEASEQWLYQPVIFDRERGDFKFYAAYYEQRKNGIPVFESGLVLLFRNEPGYPLVLARPHNLVNLTDFVVPDGAAQPVNQPAIGDRTIVGDPQTVIFVEDRNVEEGAPRLAVRFAEQFGRPGQAIMHDVFGRPRQGSYDVREVVIDSGTGETLLDRSLIRAVDVVGSVSGNASPGLLPDTSSNPPQLFALPNTRVSVVGGNSANTDQLGEFVIAHGGGTPVTVHSDMHGPALSNGVSTAFGLPIVLDLNITPPGPADFLHNASPTEFTTAQVNAMLQASTIHTWLGDINPAFPGLSRSFRAIVNIADTCNAFYDGEAINFFRSGGGCVNTAYSTVVYHEYGHKIVDDGASNPSGDYHEGMADCISMVLTDDPVVGAGFSGPGSIIRSGNNSRNYPCGGEAHFCGQVISGCVWHTRDALTVTEPSNYLDIIRNLTVNQVLIHTGGIDPGVTIDFLTLDDNDGDIANGTPHYDEIDEGFGRHNMPAPPLELLEFNYPNGLPDTISPDGATIVRVEVSANVLEPVPGSGELHYDTGSGFQSVPMTQVSPNVYDAHFPVLECGAIANYYFSSDTDEGQLATDPPGAPDDGVHSGFVARSLNVIFEDDFQTNQGWTIENIQLTDGAWQRGVPAGDGSRGDPTTDFDGSGQCYLTANRIGNSDVDGGPTILTSPSFDGSTGVAYLSYARWFTNDDNDADRLNVEVSLDNGQNWIRIESVGGGAGWVYRNVNLNDFVTPTNTMKVRFTATDNPNDSVTEAAIDAVRVAIIVCDNMVLEAEPLVRGQPADLTASLAEPGERVYFVYSIAGTGNTFVPALGVTLGLDNPRLAGSSVADAGGVAVFTTNVPQNAGIRLVWLQAAHTGRVSNVVETQTN